MPQSCAPKRKEFASAMHNAIGGGGGAEHVGFCCACPCAMRRLRHAGVCVHRPYIPPIQVQCTLNLLALCVVCCCWRDIERRIGSRSKVFNWRSRIHVSKRAGTTHQTELQTQGNPSSLISTNSQQASSGLISHDRTYW